MNWSCPACGDPIAWRKVARVAFIVFMIALGLLGAFVLLFMLAMVLL